MVGFKYKMSNIQAALGCAQMERIDELIGRKREIFAAYRDGFAGMPVAMNPEPEGCRNGYWMPTIVFEPQVRHLKDKPWKRYGSAISMRVCFSIPFRIWGISRSATPRPLVTIYRAARLTAELS